MSTNGCRLRLLTAAAFLASALQVAALINLQYTPADLAKAARDIFVVEFAKPADEKLVGKVGAVLNGRMPATKEFVINLADSDPKQARTAGDVFGSSDAITAIVLTGDFSGAKEDVATKGAAAIQIGTKWFRLERDGESLWLERDKLDLAQVWGGSARMLASALRYALAGPMADFPTVSAMRWARDAQLGSLKRPANGCLALDLDGKGGGQVLVLSDGGDRLYDGLAGEDAVPVDVTAKSKLTTASKVAAVGDFNGDGRLDIASFDGKSLRFALRSEAGVFSIADTQAVLKTCLSLSALDVGAGARAGLVAGTSKAPVLVVPDGKVSVKPTPLPVADETARAKLGEGGYCTVADFNGDGLPDVVQLFAKGILLYAGEKPGRFKAAVPTQMPLVGNPCGTVPGDYDADGSLDVLVVGKGGCLVAGEVAGRRFVNRLGETGELEYHGAQNDPPIVACAACDINNDGRQGMFIFYADRSAMGFFNRGFNSFGFGRQGIDLGVSELKGAEALGQGQSAGTITDLNSDGVADMLAVTPKGGIWVLFGEAVDRPVLGLTLVHSVKRPGPTVVTVSDKRRRHGMYVLSPGSPVFVGLEKKGAVTLEWLTPDGKKHTKRIVALKSKRIEIE